MTCHVMTKVCHFRSRQVMSGHVDSGIYDILYHIAVFLVLSDI